MIYGIVKAQKLDLRAQAAADTIDYLTAKFSFMSADWDGLVKYAHFQQGNTRYSVQLTDDKIGETEHLNLGAGEWQVYLHGNEYKNGEVIKRVTTNIATFTVEPTGVLRGDPFPEVEASVVEQIEAEIADHEERISELETQGDEFVKDVKTADGDSVVDENGVAHLPEAESEIIEISTTHKTGYEFFTLYQTAVLKYHGNEIIGAKYDETTQTATFYFYENGIMGEGFFTISVDKNRSIAVDLAVKGTIHKHDNKSVIDKFGEEDGQPTYNGEPIGAGGNVDDVVNSYGVSLLDENKVAHIKTGEMYEIFDKTERGINYIKDTPLNIYNLWHDGVKLCYQGIEITCVIRGDNNTPYYMYFINGGMGDIPYLSRAELKADKSVGNISLIRYFAEREYTAAKDNKLSGIATGAEVNVIDTIKDSNGNPLTVTSKSVTLPAIPAAQIQSDWEQSDNTAKDYIKNKPSIPAAQVQADWNESDNTKADYIKNKPTIPTAGTNNGDILVWDGSAWVSKPKWQLIYQPCEYIESSGTQYIDTGVPITSDLRIVLERANVNTGDCIEGALYNVGGTISSFSWGTIGSNNYNFSSLLGSSTAVWGNSNVPADTSKHTVDLQNGSQKLDGTEYATQTIRPKSITIGLFAWHAGGNFNTRYSSRVYSCKFYNGDTLIRDYIPVYNVFNGEIGLLDKVNNKFYGNQGTGTFTKGADVN